MGREIGGRFKREGTYVYLWLIHVDVWQKTANYCKATTLQLKIKHIFKKSGWRCRFTPDLDDLVGEKECKIAQYFFILFFKVFFFNVDHF